MNATTERRSNFHAPAQGERSPAWPTQRKMGLDVRELGRCVCIWERVCVYSWSTRRRSWELGRRTCGPVCRVEVVDDSMGRFCALEAYVWIVDGAVSAFSRKLDHLIVSQMV